MSQSRDIQVLSASCISKNTFFLVFFSQSTNFLRLKSLRFWDCANLLNHFSSCYYYGSPCLRAWTGAKDHLRCWFEACYATYAWSVSQKGKRKNMGYCPRRFRKDTAKRIYFHIEISGLIPFLSLFLAFDHLKLDFLQNCPKSNQNR